MDYKLYSNPKFHKLYQLLTSKMGKCIQYWLFGSVQNFQPIILIYRKGNIVLYNRWGCISNSWSMSDPWRSLLFKVSLNYTKKHQFIHKRFNLGCEHNSAENWLICVCVKSCDKNMPWGWEHYVERPVIQKSFRNNWITNFWTYLYKHFLYKVTKI